MRFAPKAKAPEKSGAFAFDSYAVRMRLITWNCNGHFERKCQLVLQLKPDLAVIQECSEASVAELPETYSALYVSSHKSRGIGVLFRNDLLKIALVEKLADLVVAFDVSGICTFRLFAVWTCPPKKTGYIEEMHRALDLRPELFEGTTSIIAGDWNSNTRWDRVSRKRGHASAVSRLSELGIRSLYHEQTGEAPGSETTSTFYWYRHEDKPYHIDYVFASGDLISNSKLQIESFSEWKNVSDHVPIIVDFNHSDGPFADFKIA